MKIKQQVKTYSPKASEIQRDLQQNSPYAILFQQAEQTARRKIVNGFVSGSNFDLVFYRKVTK